MYSYTNKFTMFCAFYIEKMNCICLHLTYIFIRGWWDCSELQEEITDGYKQRKGISELSIYNNTIVITTTVGDYITP